MLIDVEECKHHEFIIYIQIHKQYLDVNKHVSLLISLHSDRIRPGVQYQLK
jgi:hypothetical protein